MLNRFLGRYVEVLLPDTWVNHATDRVLTGLVESADRSYELLRDMVGGEPGLGGDRLVLAWVPRTCGVGCGLVGHGVTELWDGTSYIDETFYEPWFDEFTATAPEGCPTTCCSTR